MRQVRHTVEVSAPIEAVVLLVGAFDLIADFHPQVASCDADGDKVGSTRTLWLADGQEIEERLVEELSNGYAYEGVGGSVSMARWRGRIEVDANGEGSSVTWTLELEPADGVDPRVLLQQSQGLLEEGLASVKRQLEGLD